MQGTLQGIGDRLRQFAGAVGEEADQGLEMEMCIRDSSSAASSTLAGSALSTTS